MGLSSCFSGTGLLKHSVIPKTGPGKKFKNTDAGAEEKGERVYIFESKDDYDRISTLNQCTDYDTSWIPDSEIERDGGYYKYRIIHIYRAKNGFGGTVLTQQAFYFDSGYNIVNVESL